MSTTKQADILCPLCRKPNSRGASNCAFCGRDIVLNNAGPRYYLTGVIKAGGQGAVYTGVDDHDHSYAIKEMLEQFSDPTERAEALVRFRAEADLLKRLVHPRIPRVYSAFDDENRSYLVMDLVRGEDLEQIVARAGAQPETRVLAWADQICEVLDYLHQQSPPIIFRDLKPSNMMVQPDGTIKLVDFGIAKVLQSAQRGTQIGTPGYAPPEQYQGLATPASDVYALGATLHQLLTGRDPRDQPPFSFPAARDVQPAISQRTSAAIARAVQMRPEDRFQCVAEFRAALLPAPPTQAKPAQSATSAVRVKPAEKPAPPMPLPAAAKPAPPVSAARIASTPLASASRTPVASSARGGLGRWLIVALLILLVAGAFVVAPRFIAGPLAAPTPQTLVSQPFTVGAVELIVPAGTSADGVKQQFINVFTAQAQAALGSGAQVQADTLTFAGGAPQNLGNDANGTKYRASMQGTVLVPKP